MHPANVACLTAARIDVCVLANNHVLDYGRLGLIETLNALTRAGLKTAGAGRTLAEAEKPAIAPLASGSRVVVGAAAMESSGVPSSWTATDDRPGIAMLPDLSRRTADALAGRIRAQENDIAIASIHWGSNWGYGVPAEHVEFAHRLIDAGVDIVHGHSSHHPRPVEVYRKRLVLYGCGDLIHDYEGIGGYEAYRNDLAVMYFATMDGIGELRGLAMTPMHIHKFRLNTASADDVRWMRDSLGRACATFGSRVECARQHLEARMVMIAVFPAGMHPPVPITRNPAA